MKSLLLLLLSGLLLPLAFAANPVSTEPGPAGVTNVNVPTAVSELASGYAAAIRKMSLRTLVIYVRGAQGVVAIRGISSAQAVNGVLLVTFSAGDMMALGADSIVMVTDGTRTP